MAKGILPPSVKAGKPILGSCPTGWKSCTYGDLFKIIERPVKLLDDSDYQLVTVKRSRGGVVPREKLTGRQIKTKSAFEIEQGDFLISNRQIVHGACALVPERMSGAIVSGEYTVLNAVNGSSLEYLQHFSNSLYFQQSCYHSSIGVDIEKMVFKLDRWLKTPINFPNPEEQRKIAEILSCWDEGIALVNRLVNFKQQCFAFYLKQLFSAEDGHNCTLQDLGEIESGGTPDTTKPEYWNGNIPWCTPTEITALQSRYLTHTPRMITQDGLKGSSAKVLPPGSVVVCTRATVGATAINTVPITTNQGFKSIIVKDGVDSEFVYYLIRYLKPTLIKLSSGSTFLEISKTDFCKVDVCIPNLCRQKAISQFLFSLQDEIEKMEQLILSLKNQKKSLMQKLLTGKIRVKV